MSNLQTATYSGPIAERIATVRTTSSFARLSPIRLGFAPRTGRVEVPLRASAEPDCMTAIWLVGTEHQDRRECGEICVAEIDAGAIGLRTRTRYGIKAHHDDRLTADMITSSVPYDTPVRP